MNRPPSLLTGRRQSASSLAIELLTHPGPKRATVAGLSPNHREPGLRGQTYVRGTVRYGNFSAPLKDESEPTVLRSVWIDGEVDFLFQLPPKSITVSRRDRDTRRTYLIRSNQILPDEAR